MAIKFFTKYSPPPSFGTDFDPKEGLTQSQFAKDCDLNVILARLQRGDTSMLKSTGIYYDISNAPVDLQFALDVLRRGQEIWNSQGEVFHNRFGSVESFLDFIGNEKNRDEAIELGIFPTPEPPVSSTSSSTSSNKE